MFKVPNKKTLIGIIGASIATFSLAALAGCSSPKIPDYSYEIDGEQVSLSTITTGSVYTPVTGRIFAQNYQLTVVRVDGTIVDYFDYRRDLIVDRIDITTGGQTGHYIDDEIGRPILAEGQKQFVGYIKQIQEKALEDISK